MAVITTATELLVGYYKNNSKFKAIIFEMGAAYFFNLVYT